MKRLMKSLYSIQRRRGYKLSKQHIISCLLMFTSLLFANSLDDVEEDVQCFLNYAYIPKSYSIEKYINSQGNFQDLGISTFAAINGKGFFCLQKDEDHIILTRNGFFFWDEEGFLINHDGYKVLHSATDISTRNYKYITSEDIHKKNRNVTKMTPLAEQYKNDLESTPYLIVYPLKDVQIFDDEYLSSNEIKQISAHVIYGARELNPMQFEELYLLCCETFDEYKALEFTEQKKRIISKFEVVISYLFNTSVYTTTEKEELKKMIDILRIKI